MINALIDLAISVSGSLIASALVALFYKLRHKNNRHSE